MLVKFGLPALAIALGLMFIGKATPAQAAGPRGDILITCPMGTCNGMGVDGGQAKDVKYCKASNCKKKSGKN